MNYYYSFLLFHMKASHIAIGVVAVVIIAAAVAWVRPTDSNAPTDIAAAASGALQKGEVLVVYTNEGFIPKTLKVVRGASLRFFNASGQSALRVAPRVDQTSGSGNNAELLSSKSVKLGESFQVSVTRPGTWEYQNLNKPSMTAGVIVE